MWSPAQQQTQEAAVEFVPKLYQMLENPDFRQFVRWSDQQDSFLITDMPGFQQVVIPAVFNHSNYSSFVRQLNKYDFHKVRFRDPQSKIWEFQHPAFRPENASRPNLIKRKMPSSRSGMNDVVGDLQGRLNDLQARLSKVEGENRQLWELLNQHHQILARTGAFNDPAGLSVSQPVPGALQTTGLGPPHLQAPPHPMAVMGNPSLGPIGQLQSQGLNQNLSPQAPVALLAMDDPNARAVCIKFLQQYGLSVDVVENGRDLLKYASDTSYKYIIADLVLKEVDGLYATDIIRGTDSAVPIILVVEASPQHDTSGEFLKRGVTAVLHRPFTKSRLYEVLDLHP